MKPIAPRHRSYSPLAGKRLRGNPYFASRKSDKIGSSALKNVLSKLSPSAWLWLFFFLAIFGLLLWLTLFSNVFLVKNIEVKGADLIPYSNIESAARDRLSHHRAFVLSENRLVVFNDNALKKDLLELYPLNGIKITKKLPSTLLITLDEKKPVAVWFENDTFQEIDKDGWIISSATGPIDTLPTIYNNGTAKTGEKQIQGMETSISFAVDLNAELPKRFSSIKIKQLFVDNEINTIKLMPQKGAMIYFSITDPLAAQLDRLDLLLHSELKNRFEKVHYIDLRFGDKVYYQ